MRGISLSPSVQARTTRSTLSHAVPQPSYGAARREIVAVCRRLYERGLIAGQDGNVSVRVADDVVLVTPAGFSKVDVRAADLVTLHLDGTPPGRLREGKTPSSEVRVHLAAYRARPDIRAVVHAHPPAATGFAVAGIPLDYASLAEMVYNVGPVPIVVFAMAGGDELADRTAEALTGCDAALLANHGAVTVGPSLRIAHQRMESLEHAARILVVARLVGRVKRLSSKQVSELELMRAASRQDGAPLSGARKPTGRRSSR